VVDPLDERIRKKFLKKKRKIKFAEFDEIFKKKRPFSFNPNGRFLNSKNEVLSF